MGIIRKQAFSNSLISYIGMALGYINVTLLFPRILGSELFGLTQLLTSATVVIVQFGNLGIPNVIIRYFPVYNDTAAGKRRFLSLTLLMLTAAVLLTFMLVWIFNDEIAGYYSKKSSLFSSNLLLLFPLAGFGIFATYLDSLSVALLRSAFPAFFKEIVIRLMNLGAVVLFLYGVLDMTSFLTAFVFIQGLHCVFLMSALILTGDLKIDMHLQSLEWSRLGTFLRFGLVSLSAGIAVISNQVDIILIGAVLGLTDTAIYGVSAALASAILVPARAINRIGQAIIAQAWNQSDIRRIASIYSKSALSNLVFGGWIILGIWINEHSIFDLLPDGYEKGRNILFVLSLSRLIQMGTGLNSNIIANSEYYYLNVVFNAAMLILVVGVNLVLIPAYGLSGASYAALISAIVGNALRFTFLKWKYNLSPFDINQLYVILAGAAAYTIVSLVPLLENIILDIVLRSVLVTAFFFLPIYFFRLSNDFVELADLSVEKFKKRFF